MRFPVFLLAAVAFSTGGAAHAQERFPFVLPWDDASKTVTDLSDLNPAPLTQAHRVSVKNGHFVDQSGRRVRFLGTNFGAGANFARSEDAAKVAARLHKYGFNIVRLHHMDASWSSPSIFGANHNGITDSTAKVSPESLALLDEQVAQLKKNGIYVNLNLHVSRRLTPGDGFVDTDKLPELGKVLAYFEPRFIELQRDYARQILDHKNPRTGLRWADDPAVAVVEINNEDTLVGEAWSGKLLSLPPSYRATLQNGWNEFLIGRYKTTGALQTAWRGGATDGPNLLRNARLSDGQNGWELEQLEGAQAEIAVVPIDADAAQSTTPNGAQPQGAALKITPQKLADADWKLQLHQTGLDLKPGALYTATYWAKSETPRRITSYFALDQAPWSAVGGSQVVELSPTWKQVRTVFRAQNPRANHNRFSFSMGNDLSPVYLADFGLQEGAILDLPAEQTLETKTLDLPARGSVPTQARDWLDYLVATEQKYVDDMTQAIRATGFKGLVTCSQASYGGFAGIARESRTDFIDMHAYWQHPEFPGQPWDAQNWRIPNTAMTDDPGTGTLLSLATHRVEGKPFTVSEYNHSAPNDYASEAVPLILGYAAAQDWDGVYLFDYNSDREGWNSDRIRGYFAHDSDPNKMALVPTMARAFLRGDVPAFAAKTTLVVPRQQLIALTPGGGANENLDGFWNNVFTRWQSLGLTRRDLTGSRLEVRLVDDNKGARLERSGARGGAWKWDFNGTSGEVRIETPTARALMGRLGDDFQVGTLQSGPWKIENLDSSNGWAVLSLVSRDGKPLERSGSLLLSVLNRAENSSMTWNATRTSVGNGWGEGPALLETPRADMELQTGAASAQVFRLDATGKRAGSVQSRLRNGVLKWRVDDSTRSPWYEIAATFKAAAKPASKPIKRAAKR